MYKKEEEIKILKRRLNRKSKRVRDLEKQLQYYKLKYEATKVPAEPNLSVDIYIYIFLIEIKIHDYYSYNPHIIF